jgi:hypothetical protein
MNESSGAGKSFISCATISFSSRNLLQGVGKLFIDDSSKLLAGSANKGGCDGLNMQLE